MEKENEQILIQRIQRESSRESANKLIGMYYLEIYAFAYKQVGEKDMAMDLTQDIFVSVLQSISNYNEQKASFRTWLYRIASNKSVDYFRSSAHKFRKMSINIDSVVIPQETTLESDYIDSQLTAEILKELANLPFVTQQIVRLKVYADQCFRDIAAELSLPESTVKSKYYSAVKTVREKVMEK